MEGMALPEAVLPAAVTSCDTFLAWIDVVIGDVVSERAPASTAMVAPS